MGDQSEKERDEIENELKDLTWQENDEKLSNKKALSQFKQLAQDVITAINEDAEWLDLVNNNDTNNNNNNNNTHSLLLFRQRRRNPVLLSWRAIVKTFSTKYAGTQHNQTYHRC